MADAHAGVAILDRSQILAQLSHLKNLTPGWNGYGAIPIDREIIAAAERLIAFIPDELLATPQVVPRTRGRLQFEWHGGGRSLELEIETPAIVHYLKTDPEAGIEEEEAILIQHRDQIIDLLSWFSAK